MAEKTATLANPLEQFVLLAKTAKGAAAVELIKQTLEAPGVHVFGELLDMPHIQELAEGQYEPYHRLLNLFAYGTYRQYIEAKSSLPEITPVQQQKLRHLTLVTLSEENKRIPYNTLVQELDVKNLRELEDLIIEAIYADIIHGKLDQKNACLEVDFAIGRDVKPNDVGEVIQTLSDWCEACDSVLGSIESQITRANMEKDKHIKHRTTIEEEIANIRKTLKTHAQETDDLNSEPREALSHDKAKKPAKGKGLRASSAAKFWKS